MHRATVFTLGLLAVATSARAQQAIEPAAIVLPVSARAAGLANAYVLSDPDSDAVFYNPGLVNTARGLSASLSRFGSASQLISASAGVEWWKGALTFGVASLSYSATSTDTGAFAAGEPGLWQQGPATASELTAVVSYAQTVFGFRVGGAARLLDLRVNAERSVSGSYDIGVVRGVGPVTLGFAAQHLGPDPDLGTLDARLPHLLTASAATRSRPMGPLDVTFVGASSWHGGDFRSAGGGVEVSYWPIRGRTFTGRVGYRWVEESDLAPLTLGIGFSGDSLAIDYAFERVDDGRATHRVTFRIG